MFSGTYIMTTPEYVLSRVNEAFWAASAEVEALTEMMWPLIERPLRGQAITNLNADMPWGRWIRSFYDRSSDLTEGEIKDKMDELRPIDPALFMSWGSCSGTTDDRMLGARYEDNRARERRAMDELRKLGTAARSEERGQMLVPIDLFNRLVKG